MRETLADIVGKYSTQKGRKMEKLKDFIDNSSNIEFNHMVVTLEDALRDRMDTGNKQKKIYLVDLGLSYDRNYFEYRIQRKYGSDNNDDDVEVDTRDPFDGGRRRRRKRTRKRKKSKRRRRKRKRTKKKRRRRRRK